MPYGKLEEYIKSMDDEQRSKATIDVTVHSSIVVNHKKFDKYNDLYAELSKAQLAEDDRIRQEAQIAYDRSIKALGTHITEDIKDKFVDAININERITNQLKPHINTLFFISLSFYDHYWDTFGENFNGAIADNPLGDLEYNEQPHHYRASKQLEFISNLLYSHYSKPNPYKKINSYKELNVIIRGREHITDDPQLVNWLMTLITGDNLPASLDYNGVVLGKLLNYREQMKPKEFLIQLKKFTTLGAPDFTDMKRKVVKQYCLAVHKIFSYYMKLPDKTFSGKRLHIYHEILKAFQMEDFSKTKRKRETENKRKVTPEDRLGDLLRSNPLRNNYK